MGNLTIGILYGFIAQVLTFLQLQGNVKYGWYERYPLVILLASIPISWLYVKSVNHFVAHFKGEIWPSRMIGFGIGIIVFSLMSYFLFKEPINLKTSLSILLAGGILAIQIFMK